jgi:ABC-2 type transport system ATP-binding protein
MSDFAIEANQLRKEFQTKVGFWSGKKKETLAVENVSFNVRKGELFGLLGPNGAGKTTTIKMLTTLLLPTSGNVSVFGMDVVAQTLDVRKRIGFTFGGSRGLYARLSALDNLKYFAELYALEPSKVKSRIDELLAIVGLLDRAEDRVETYSSGMQQRLHLARALLHDPELIFLDEPTVGIDPVGAREVRKIVKELIDRGKTVLLTTHYMAEAEELCDRIAIIKEGNIVALDTPSALKSRISGDSVINIEIEDENLSKIKNQLQQVDSQLKLNVDNTQENTKISIRTREPDAIMNLLSSYLSTRQIRGLEVRNQTLEDVYVSIIEGEKSE